MTSQPTLPVLIVEDDAPTQKLLRAVLSRSGFQSEVAPNGEVAIQMLFKSDYAAIILDMMMPGSGGQDVIDYIARASRITPVVICSAAGPALLSGFDPSIVHAVIRKPFDVQELTTAVQRVVVAGVRGQP